MLADETDDWEIVAGAKGDPLLEALEIVDAASVAEAEAQVPGHVVGPPGAPEADAAPGEAPGSEALDGVLVDPPGPAPLDGVLLDPADADWIQVTTRGTASEPPFLVRRTFLLSRDRLDPFRESHKTRLVTVKDTWTETFYDTVSSSLSESECILKVDSSAPKYWKFFCFAKDSLTEMTTDEKDIREPLSRLVNFRSADQVTSDLLKPFFRIQNATEVYEVNGVCVTLTFSDFGFAFCTLEHFCLGPGRLVPVLEEIEHQKDVLGLSSLATYEPLDYV